MKAIRVYELGDPEVLRLDELPDPQPLPGQVLVRVHAVGVNPVETYIRSGKYGILPSLPYTPGTDAAGVVEAIGGGVTRVAVGDRVYTAGSLTGAYASLTLCAENRVHLLPPRVSFEQGAAVNIPYATAFRALFQRAKAIPGETVLIHGASGGVGVAATQIAHAAGLRVIGTAGTDRGQKMVAEQGAHHVLNHRESDYAEKILKFTAGQGVDLILEMLANVNLGKDLTLLARGGRVVVIGSRGSVEINPRDVMSRDAAVLGMVLFNTPEKELAVIHAGLVAGLENGTLRPVLGQRFSLSDAARAHRAVMEPGAFGKIVLTP
ncbi:MAG: NADPH:quinone reductase [Verrucomicrobia bacterium]|nr:NADPH:quinone reductase [Verrucomicrobiota bacterium]